MCQQCYEKGLYEEDAKQIQKTPFLEGFKLMGKFFGYPDCCIDFFVNRVKNMGLAGDDEEKFKKAYELHSSQEKYIHGFIPCVECAKKYPPGKEGELISNRTSSYTYPNEGTYKQFEDEFDLFINSQNLNKNAKS